MSAPSTEAEIAEIVRAAAEKRAPLEIVAGGTRRGVGRPAQAAEILPVAGLRGVSLYEPEALTLVARPGEPLAEIERTLAAEGQRLSFEPPDWRGLLGSSGEPTIGGAVASNLSGPRRIQAGACRDSLIGVRFVDGRGEAIKNGGRVMKNVTGYDLVKLLCGSWGTLGVLTEVAFKLTPAPEKTATLALRGLSDAAAIAAMAAALGSPYEASGAAHLPAAATPDGAEAVTLLRLEGFAESIAHRGPALARLLASYGAATLVEDAEEVAAGWAYVRDVSAFAGKPGAVWRLSVKPSEAPALTAAIRAAIEAEVFYDWGGGLVWLLTPETGDAGAAAIRGEIGKAGGHATLIRAGAATRAAIPSFQPEPPRLAALSEELRARFDPAGILNPGRMV